MGEFSNNLCRAPSITPYKKMTLSSLNPNLPPLFTTIPSAGCEKGVRFFQSPCVRKPIAPARPLEGRRDEIYPPFSVDIEQGHQILYRGIENSGGVFVGLSFLQTLSLAAHANAAALVFINFDPYVALTLPLLLSLFPRNPRPIDFFEDAKTLFSARFDKKRFLDLIPSDYQAAFEEHIETLRDIYYTMFNRSLYQTFSDDTSFLGDQLFYDRIARLVMLGNVSVIYGDLFSLDMPDLVHAALGNHEEEQIRAVFLANALRWVAEKSPETFSPLLQLLRTPRTDPEGRLLQSHLKESVWRFTSLPMTEASELMERYGNAQEFLAQIESSHLLG